MKKGNFLFVDNDEHYLSLVKAIVEQAGVEARYASSGEEAVGILKEESIATLITDLNMPGMDGIELALIARELSPDIEVFMITGNGSPEVRRLAAEAGIARVLLKPIRAIHIQRIARCETKRHMQRIAKRTRDKEMPAMIEDIRAFTDHVVKFALAGIHAIRRKGSKP